MRVALGFLTLLLLPLSCLGALPACPQPPVAGTTTAQEAALDAIFNKVVVQSAGCTTAVGSLCGITKIDLIKLQDQALDASINYSACSAKKAVPDINKAWYRKRAAFWYGLYVDMTGKSASAVAAGTYAVSPELQAQFLGIVLLSPAPAPTTSSVVPAAETSVAPPAGHATSPPVTSAAVGPTVPAAEPSASAAPASTLAVPAVPGQSSSLVLYQMYTKQKIAILRPVVPVTGSTGKIEIQDCKGNSIPIEGTSPDITDKATDFVQLTLKTPVKNTDTICALETYTPSRAPDVAMKVEVTDRPALTVSKGFANDKTVVVNPIPPGPYKAEINVYTECSNGMVLGSLPSLIDTASSRSVDPDGNPLTVKLVNPLTPVAGKVCAVETYKVPTGTNLPVLDSDASEPMVIGDTAEVPPPGYDWGRVRAYFTLGALLSQQQDQFSHADTFLAFRIDKTYLQTKNLNASGQHNWTPGLNTYFEPRLTAIPVSVQPCTPSSNSSNNSSTTCSNTSSGDITVSSGSGSGGGTASAKATTDASSTDPQVFLNSQKSARLTFGVYAPILLDRWTVKGKNPNGSAVNTPYSLYLAPLAKTGFDTAVNGLNQTQQQGSTPTTVQPVGNSGSFYKYWEFGFRLGHYKLSGDEGTAHEQISNLDVGWGRFSNMASLLCPEPSYKGNGICNNPDPAVTLRYSNDFRLHAEGLLQVPATGGFSVGFSANVAAKGVDPTAITGTPYIHIRPPDDLRFFFGYKFDIGNIAAKLANK